MAGSGLAGAAWILHGRAKRDAPPARTFFLFFVLAGGSLFVEKCYGGGGKREERFARRRSDGAGIGWALLGHSRSVESEKGKDKAR